MYNEYVRVCKMYDALVLQMKVDGQRVEQRWAGWEEDFYQVGRVSSALQTIGPVPTIGSWEDNQTGTLPHWPRRLAIYE